ncbi:MAG: hypothetical protein JWN90_125 [Parcubacteria group bacterium]|nr:hypothetical protein [Parcubacteria group bacterium]
MISDQDITKLKTVFATKEEFRGVKEEIADLRLEVGEVKDSVDYIHVKLDRFLGRIDTLDIENAAGAVSSRTKHSCPS